VSPDELAEQICREAFLNQPARVQEVHLRFDGRFYRLDRAAVELKAGRAVLVLDAGPEDGD
jgi:hypothetical protein